MGSIARGCFGRRRIGGQMLRPSAEALRVRRASARAIVARMSEVLDIAADRRAGRRSGPRQHPVRAARRPRADRERTRLCGARHAADRERPSRQARQGEPDRSGAAGPPPLFQARRRACRRDDGEHLGGRGDRAAAAAADPHRRHDAPGAHVLRPRRRPARRHARRCAARARPCRIRRRWRRGHAIGRGILRQARHRSFGIARRAGACSAAPASTGASGARISRARSAPRWRAG